MAICSIHRTNTGAKDDCVKCITSGSCVHAGNHVCCNCEIREKLLASGHAKVTLKGKVVIKTLYEMCNTQIKMKEDAVLFQENVRDVILRTFQCVHCELDFRAEENVQEELQCPTCHGVFSYRQHGLCIKGCSTTCIVVVEEGTASNPTCSRPRKRRRKNPGSQLPSTHTAPTGVKPIVDRDNFDDKPDINTDVRINLTKAMSAKIMYERVRINRIVSSYEDLMFMSIFGNNAEDAARH